MGSDVDVKSYPNGGYGMQQQQQEQAIYIIFWPKTIFMAVQICFFRSMPDENILFCAHGFALLCFLYTYRANPALKWVRQI